MEYFKCLLSWFMKLENHLLSIIIFNTLGYFNFIDNLNFFWPVNPWNSFLFWIWIADSSIFFFVTGKWNIDWTFQTDDKLNLEFEVVDAKLMKFIDTIKQEKSHFFMIAASKIFFSNFTFSDFLNFFVLKIISFWTGCRTSNPWRLVLSIFV